VLPTNGLIVILGALIMIAGLVYSIRIVLMLRKYDLSRPWIMLAVMISFFLLGYVFIAARFMRMDMMPVIPLEALMSTIFFFGAVFVTILAVLNHNLFGDIFGKGIDDTSAFRIFADYVGMPPRKVMAMTRKDYAVACEICGGEVHYSVPEIVRTHPRIDRGVVVERAMGGTNYRFYVRHYCGKELREIPVRHDSEFEYRSHRPSRPVYG
jgi:hypothetical protein